MSQLRAQPVEWMSSAPVRVSVSRTIAADPDTVFAVLADHERWPSWFESLTKVEVTGASSGVGATRSVWVKGLGRLDEEFVAWDPGRAFGFTVVAMDRPVFRSLTELVTLEPSGDTAIVTYAQAFDPRPWIAPIIRLMAKRRMPKTLEAALDELEREALPPAP